MFEHSPADTFGRGHENALSWQYCRRFARQALILPLETANILGRTATFPRLSGHTLMRKYSQTDSSSARGRVLLVWRSVVLLLVSIWINSANLAAAESEVLALSQIDLLQLSLGDLGRIKVTTVSRKSESLSTAPAAIDVITQEEIRRSGANTIPEALRWTPGLEVARANARQWAVSARGFNAVYANKLLVLMDGRTLYTPLFSGVIWEQTDTVLEDIERIEVIRGPGATLWGANAVNGVINIITKGARDTQGLMISGGGGVEERGFGTIRYGGRLATNVHYRVYTKYANRDAFTRVDGLEANDAWWLSQSGFRLDWNVSESDRLTFQGDYFEGDFGFTVNRHSLDPPGLVPTDTRSHAQGQNLLGRWAHEFSARSDLSVQAYYNRTDRDFGIGGEVRDTVDVDGQHRFQLGGRQEFVWGLGYRYSADRLEETPDFVALDNSLGLQLFSSFIQDEIELLRDQLKLTLGTKLEHNDFTGFELQPSARMAWMPHERHALWWAVSRAVRTPSRVERGVNLFVDPPDGASQFPLPVIVPGSGNPELDSEDVITFELGYRTRVNPRLLVDVAGFFSRYDRLRSPIQSAPELRLAPSPHIVVPATLGNALSADTWGAEVAATWQPADAWRLRGGYGLFQFDLRSNDAGAFAEKSITQDPAHQAFLWSDADLGSRLEWGVGIRYVDDIAAHGIRAYTELDTRLAWKPVSACELAIVGRNLIQPHHLESTPALLVPRNIRVDREVFLKVTWRF